MFRRSKSRRYVSPPPSPPSPPPTHQGDEEDMEALPYFISLEPLMPQPPGDNLGIIFTSETIANDFYRMRGRRLFNTRFYDREDMEHLGIHDGITTLFKNIGWQQFLTWDDLGYARPTLEFLSSLTMFNGLYYFRFFNQWYSLSPAQVCSLIDAPNCGEMIDLNDTQLAQFWKEITGMNNYDPGKHLRSSYIKHPALRVAFRVLACTFYGKDELNNINNIELKILWCMVNKPSATPNFGSFLLNRLWALRGAMGSIHMTGIITTLLKHPSLGINFPNGEIPLGTERYLGKTNFFRGFLVKEDPDSGTFVWMLGPQKVPYLEIKNRRFGIFKLKRPTSSTQWNLESNISGGDVGGDTQGDAGAGTSGAASGSAPPHDWYHPEAQWYTDMNNNYQGLQNSYNNLYGQHSTLQNNYNALYGSYSTLSDDVSGLHTNYSTLNDNYSTMHSSLSELQRNFETERNENRAERDENREFRSDMHRMVDSIFQWNINEHPSYAPPPPPPPR